MDPRLVPVRTTLGMNAGLFRRALDGVNREQAHRRPNDRTNHLAFLAAHTLDGRYALLRLAGGEDENPHASLLAGATTLEEVETFPPLGELREGMPRTEERVDELFSALEAGALDESSPMDLPIGEASRLRALAFLGAHETYHVGQMGLVRKFLGFPPVVSPRGRGAGDAR